MENTLENKLKFFAQYYNQRLLKGGRWQGLKPVHDKWWTYMGKDKFLELKPLSSITDEDAKKLGFRCAKHFKSDANELAWKDELRLLGYAVEWVNLSVEKLQEYGWIKLSNNLK